MKSNTQELDGIMDKIYDLAYDHLPERGIAIGTDRIRQAILDWHNRQVEAVLDRIEKQATIITSLSGEKAGTVDLTAIEVERNKLKEATQ